MDTEQDTSVNEEEVSQTAFDDGDEGEQAQDARGEAGPKDSGASKTVQLPTSALKRIKNQAREQGKKAALSELESQLKEAGFSSLTEALRSITELKRKVSSAPQERREPHGTERNMANNGSNNRHQNQQRRNGANGSARNAAQAAGMSTREYNRLQRQIEQERKQREALIKKWRKEEKARRELQRKLEAKEAEMQLREAAIQAGVRDVDYAIRLLTRELQGKPEEEVQKFNEMEFFKGLQETHPYLFGEVTRPATTGGDGGKNGAPPPPKPDEVTKQQAEGDQIDARKMKPDEFKKRLQQLGLDTTI